MKIVTSHCSNFRRYTTRFGKLVIPRDKEAWPKIYPSELGGRVDVRVSRPEAALGLRNWRRIPSEVPSRKKITKTDAQKH